ncbi:hypothetical protein JKY72_03155 [Candidatus Gracilibacteria bacterium]|nr:hypothetical protein [Candidatus Gracilibacteria bacterium]
MTNELTAQDWSLVEPGEPIPGMPENFGGKHREFPELSRYLILASEAPTISGDHSNEIWGMNRSSGTSSIPYYQSGDFFRYRVGQVECRPIYSSSERGPIAPYSGDLSVDRLLWAVVVAAREQIAEAVQVFWREKLKVSDPDSLNLPIKFSWSWLRFTELNQALWGEADIKHFTGNDFSWLPEGCKLIDPVKVIQEIRGLLEQHVSRDEINLYTSLYSELGLQSRALSFR